MWRSVVRCRSATVSFVGRHGVWSSLAERFNVRVARPGSLPRFVAGTEPVEARLFWHHRFDACARRHASQTRRQARRTPLMRFGPLQHFPAASHCPGAASRSGTVPLRRLPRQPLCRHGSSLRFSVPIEGPWTAHFCAVRGSRGPGRVMHRRFLASDVPLPADLVRALSQPGCHHCSSAHGVVPFAVLILTRG